MTKQTKNPGKSVPVELTEERLDAASGGGDGTTEHFFTIEIKEGRKPPPPQLKS